MRLQTNTKAGRCLVLPIIPSLTQLRTLFSVYVSIIFHKLARRPSSLSLHIFSRIVLRLPSSTIFRFRQPPRLVEIHARIHIRTYAPSHPDETRSFVPGSSFLFRHPYALGGTITAALGIDDTRKGASFKQSSFPSYFLHTVSIIRVFSFLFDNEPWAPPATTTCRLRSPRT